ncbi:hypothetical protein, variant 5 [Aphanomyces astaci]|nr:hypothetical protein, variant 4 [Aphanomyces astaci]XP_009845851.1 hypothetical protein, variant 5 [Aphanomyces astaci]ETV64654.1 hypothetical protein, variant 4 [Aphanomyces astaci]ETV64655.1 hypothetical protein, variant 5 [Aphanomyces astaci]|eukprot:XP_009845850.1 hypothetical protein, variant 4 [Aphanomyces astaci]
MTLFMTKIRDGCVSFALRVLAPRRVISRFFRRSQSRAQYPIEDMQRRKEHDFWEKLFGLATATPRYFAFGEVHDVPHIGKLKVIEFAGLSRGLSEQGRRITLDMRATEPNALQLIGICQQWF